MRKRLSSSGVSLVRVSSSTIGEAPDVKRFLQKTAVLRCGEPEMKIIVLLSYVRRGVTC